MNFISKAAELSSQTELFVKDEAEERTIRAFLMPVYTGRGSSACPGRWSYSQLYLGRKETASLQQKLGLHWCKSGRGFKDEAFKKLTQAMWNNYVAPKFESVSMLSKGAIWSDWCFLRLLKGTKVSGMQKPDVQRDSFWTKKGEN